MNGGQACVPQGSGASGTGGGPPHSIVPAPLRVPGEGAPAHGAGAFVGAGAGAPATPRQVLHRSPLEQPLPYALTRYDVEHYEVLQAYTAKNDNLLPLPQNLVSFLGVLSAHKQAVGRQLEQHGLNMHTQTPDCGFGQLHVRTSASTGVGPGQARRLYDRQATLVLPMVLGCEGEYGSPNINTLVARCAQMKRMLDAVVAEVRAAADPVAARRQLVVEADASAEVNPASDSAWLDRNVPRSLASELGADVAQPLPQGAVARVFAGACSLPRRVAVVLLAPTRPPVQGQQHAKPGETKGRTVYLRALDALTAAGLRPVKQARHLAGDEVVCASPVRVGQRDTMHATAATTSADGPTAACRLVRLASRVALYACAASHERVFADAVGESLSAATVYDRDDAPKDRVASMVKFRRDLDEVSKVDDAMVCLLYHDGSTDRPVLHCDRLGDRRHVGECLRELLQQAHRTTQTPLLSPEDCDALCCGDHVQARMERTHLHPAAASRAPPVEYNPCHPASPAGAFYLLVRVHFDLGYRASMELEPSVHSTVFRLHADADQVARRPMLQTLSYCRINPPQSDQLAAELHRLELTRQSARDHAAALDAEKRALDAERRGGGDEDAGLRGFEDMFQGGASASATESQRRNLVHELDDVHKLIQRVDGSVRTTRGQLLHDERRLTFASPDSSDGVLLARHVPGKGMPNVTDDDVRRRHKELYDTLSTEGSRQCSRERGIDGSKQTMGCWQMAGPFRFQDHQNLGGNITFADNDVVDERLRQRDLAVIRSAYASELYVGWRRMRWDVARPSGPYSVQLASSDDCETVVCVPTRAANAYAPTLSCDAGARHDASREAVLLTAQSRLDAVLDLLSDGVTQLYPSDVAATLRCEHTPHQPSLMTHSGRLGNFVQRQMLLYRDTVADRLGTPSSMGRYSCVDPRANAMYDLVPDVAMPATLAVVAQQLCNAHWRPVCELREAVRRQIMLHQQCASYGAGGDPIALHSYTLLQRWLGAMAHDEADAQLTIEELITQQVERRHAHQRQLHMLQMQLREQEQLIERMRASAASQAMALAQATERACQMQHDVQAYRWSDEAAVPDCYHKRPKSPNLGQRASSSD